MQLDNILVEAQSIVEDAFKIAQLTGTSVGDISDLQALVVEVQKVRADTIDSNKDVIEAAVNSVQNSHVGIGAVYLVVSIVFILAALSRVCILLCIGICE